MKKKPRVYIEDFEMPECCAKCPFVVYWEYDHETSCKASKHFIWNGSPDKMRHSKCPLRDINNNS